MNNDENNSSLKGVIDVLEGIKKEAPTANENTLKGETISDDFDLDDAEMKKIKEVEEIVREALAVFEINYDELIKMDGRSAYCKAVNANPLLLEEVKKSKNPVLSALKIAVSYKPYAEFSEKYGVTPEEIKSNMKKEIEAEMKQKSASEEQNSAEIGTAFSKLSQGFYNGIKNKKANKTKNIFKK